MASETLPREFLRFILPLFCLGHVPDGSHTIGVYRHVWLCSILRFLQP